MKRKLFFTEEPTTLVCVIAKSGKLLWKRDNDLLNLMGLNEKEIEKSKSDGYGIGADKKGDRREKISKQTSGAVGV